MSGPRFEQTIMDFQVCFMILKRGKRDLVFARSEEKKGNGLFGSEEKRENGLFDSELISIWI